ncbi:MAG: hypothetical protein K2I28_00225 [Muribaculaceae bacterium]|nr:hypothetical protein [Muribaculaceae bacterium]
MRTLTELAPEICQAAIESINFVPIDGDSATFNFTFDDDNWSITGTLTVGGEWITFRGSYELPDEDTLRRGWGTLVNLEVDCRHEETDERLDYPIGDFNSLWAELDYELDQYMQSYQI